MKKGQKFNKFIGIDVSKDKLDIYYSWNYKNEQIKNNKSSIKSFVKYLKVEKQNLLVVIDLTGGYEATAVKYFCKAGFNVHRTEGRKVKNFIRAYGENAKTDKIDAFMLTEYAKSFQNRLKLYKYNEKEEQETNLANIVRRLSDIEDILQKEKNRFKSPNNDAIVKSIQQMIKILNKQKEQIEQQIQQEIDKDEQLKGKQQAIIAQKGIGIKTSMLLLSLLPELGKLNRREIAALSGVAPYSNDSGTIHGRRNTKTGRKQVKRALFICALVAIKYDIKIKTFYEKLINNGKLKIVAVVACMRKLLVVLNARCKAFYNNSTFIEY